MPSDVTTQTMHTYSIVINFHHHNNKSHAGSWIWKWYQLTLCLHWATCRGYVTTVETALATAPSAKYCFPLRAWKIKHKSKISKYFNIILFTQDILFSHS